VEFGLAIPQFEGGVCFHHSYDANPDAVAFSPLALEAALAMEDPSVQQGTPHDLSRIGQLADELPTRFADLIPLHQS
jgi:hypothetical protein